MNYYGSLFFKKVSRGAGEQTWDLLISFIDFQIADNNNVTR
jgi:hypothetical protein